jgi:carbohydrate-selective porin OprB
MIQPMNTFNWINLLFPSRGLNLTDSPSLTHGFKTKIDEFGTLIRVDCGWTPILGKEYSVQHIHDDVYLL